MTKISRFSHFCERAYKLVGDTVTQTNGQTDVFFTLYILFLRKKTPEKWQMKVENLSTYTEENNGYLNTVGWYYRVTVKESVVCAPISFTVVTSLIGLVRKYVSRLVQGLIHFPVWSQLSSPMQIITHCEWWAVIEVSSITNLSTDTTHKHTTCFTDHLQRKIYLLSVRQFVPQNI
jgi:hypothetical protein